MSIDLGVFIRKKLIDVISLGKVKYALYEPLNISYMCRHADFKVLVFYRIYIAEAKALFKSLVIQR